MSCTIEVVESHIRPSELRVSVFDVCSRLNLANFSPSKKNRVLEKFPASRGTKSLAVAYYVLTKVGPSIRPFDNHDKPKKTEKRERGKTKKQEGGFSATKKEVLKEAVSTALSTSAGRRSRSSER